MSTVRDCVGGCLDFYFINYEINCIVIYMRPKMAMNLGSRSATDVCGFVVNSYQRVLLFTLIVTQNNFV